MDESKTIADGKISAPLRLARHIVAISIVFFLSGLGGKSYFHGWLDLFYGLISILFTSAAMLCFLILFFTKYMKGIYISFFVSASWTLCILIAIGSINIKNTKNENHTPQDTNTTKITTAPIFIPIKEFIIPIHKKNKTLRIGITIEYNDHIEASNDLKLRIDNSYNEIKLDISHIVNNKYTADELLLDTVKNSLAIEIKNIISANSITKPDRILFSMFFLD